jgi:hypothetical protein
LLKKLWQSTMIICSVRFYLLDKEKCGYSRYNSWAWRLYESIRFPFYFFVCSFYIARFYLDLYCEICYWWFLSLLLDKLEQMWTSLNKFIHNSCYFMSMNECMSTKWSDVKIKTLNIDCKSLLYVVCVQIPMSVNAFFLLPSCTFWSFFFKDRLRLEWG